VGKWGSDGIRGDFPGTTRGIMPLSNTNQQADKKHCIKKGTARLAEYTATNRTCSQSPSLNIHINKMHFKSQNLQ